jgi:hypothetical protein
MVKTKQTPEQLFITQLKKCCDDVEVKIIARNRYVEASKIKLFLQIETFPSKYFPEVNTRIGTGSDKGKEYRLLANIIKFVKYSVNDNDLGKFTGPGIVLWRNPHYVIDFHKPLGWYDSEIKKESYSEQVLIMVDIIENVLDKYGSRGISEYKLSKCTHMNYRPDYYIYFHLKPLIIEINEKHHKQKAGESRNDENKDMLNSLFYVLQIDADRWNNKDYRNQKLNYIKELVRENMPKIFMKSLMCKSNEIKEAINILGNLVVTSLINNDDFPFELESVLDKLGVSKKSKKYNEIYNQFVTNIDEFDNNYDDNLSDKLDDNFEDYDNLSDDEHIEEHDKSKIDDIFIVDKDYIVDNEMNKIYINQFVLQIIATQIGNEHAITYQRKVFELQKFIQKYGNDACDELNKLYDKLCYYFSETENKNRCNAIIATSKIKKNLEVITLEREIENLLKHNKMLQTKIDIFELQQINHFN